MTNRILRESERAQKTGIPTSTWYELQGEGLAPKPVSLGPRSVGWVESELDIWIASRVAERDEQVA